MNRSQGEGAKHRTFFAVTPTSTIIGRNHTSRYVFSGPQAGDGTAVMDPTTYVRASHKARHGSRLTAQLARADSRSWEVCKAREP